MAWEPYRRVGLATSMLIDGTTNCVNSVPMIVPLTSRALNFARRSA